MTTKTKNTMMKMTTSNPHPPTHPGDYSVSRIGTLALEAMLVEVSVTPKPGLVDRNNSGAHRDMGFFTFIRSAASLRKYFEEFANIGRSNHTDKIFPLIRKCGIEAEKEMFKATQGINTHKGEIFSLGVLSAAAGHLEENITGEKILSLAGEICAGLCEMDFAGVHDKAQLTKGERVYIEHGITGIRGEAEAGYPVIRDVALPAFKQYLAKGLSLNDALAFTLIHIIANSYDTNIISRHDLNTAKRVMTLAQNMLASDLSLEKIYELDQKFIDAYISPGGSGDLLAVTYFIYCLDNLQ